MRNYFFLAMTVLGSLVLSSCGSSKKVASPSMQPQTYVQPCSSFVTEKGFIRAWAVGISDTEMTAKKKANAEASAELASILQKIVGTTIDNYCVTLSEGEIAESKSFLNEKTKITINQTLVGVHPVCDQWTPKDEKGMYRNYLVLELSGSEFLGQLNNELKKSASVQKVDQALLKEKFLQAIDDYQK